MRYTIEMDYLAKDTMFLFRVCQELTGTPGIEILDVSGGVVTDKAGKSIGREGVISVEAEDSDELKVMVDAAAARFQHLCGLEALNMVIKREDGTICSPYLPSRLRKRSRR